MADGEFRNFKRKPVISFPSLNLSQRAGFPPPFPHPLPDLSLSTLTSQLFNMPPMRGSPGRYDWNYDAWGGAVQHTLLPRSPLPGPGPVRPAVVASEIHAYHHADTMPHRQAFIRPGLPALTSSLYQLILPTSSSFRLPNSALTLESWCIYAVTKFIIHRLQIYSVLLRRL